MEIAQLLKRLANNPRPVIVDIWAEWCGPCKYNNYILDRLAKEYEGRVEVWKINADENMALTQSLNVYQIPAIIAFNGIDEVTRLYGAQPTARLERLFNLAIDGKLPPKDGLDGFDRFMRMAAGILIFALGYFASHTVALMILGAFLMGYAYYDRLPVIGPWLAKPKTAAIPPESQTKT